MTTNPPLSKRLIASLTARSETQQWEELIGTLLRRLELDPAERANVEIDYLLLAERIAKKLGISRDDVYIFPQGSMRTQTTISQRYPVKFDLDIVVKLTGRSYSSPNPDAMFADFGKALEGNESVTGAPEAKRRCWRLPYPGKAYYFDVTPAVKDQTQRAGSVLSVRDPDTQWAPSNPEEFAQWFCDHADKKFPFQQVVEFAKAEATTSIEPLPEGRIGLSDVLRRAVQLMKLHRDTYYWGSDEQTRAAMPISVIIVTLATWSYAELLAKRANEFQSSIEVVLELVEAMPHFIEGDSNEWRVENPRLQSENFADKWNNDGGERHKAFHVWHRKLVSDLEALLYQSSKLATVDKIRSVFGAAGVEAWQASKPAANILDGLIASAGSHIKQNPTSPNPMGSSNQLG